MELQVEMFRRAAETCRDLAGGLAALRPGLWRGRAAEEYSRAVAELEAEARDISERVAGAHRELALVHSRLGAAGVPAGLAAGGPAGTWRGYAAGGAVRGSQW